MDTTPGIRPRPGVWHMLDVVSRHAFPFVQSVLVVLVLGAPFGLPGQAQLQWAWAVSSVFFWSLYRPGAMPALLVFVLGVLLDLLAQGPLGVKVLVLLLVHAVALRSRRWLVRSGFGLVWLVFVGVGCGAACMVWGLSCAVGWLVLPVWPGVLAMGVSAGVYPFLAYYFIGLHRTLAAPERAA